MTVWNKQNIRKETTKSVFIWCPALCKHNKHGNCQTDHSMEMFHGKFFASTTKVICKEYTPR